MKIHTLQHLLKTTESIRIENVPYLRDTFWAVIYVSPKIEVLSKNQQLVVTNLCK